MSTESDGTPASAGSVGARLRAAREARQVSLRQIAATTKISVGALEALEQTDLSRLPGGIFTRAFVRSYATEVGLDPEETMRDFTVEVDEAQVSESALADAESQQHDLFQSQQRMAGTALTLVLIGLPVALLLGFLGTRGSSTPDDGTAPLSVAAVETPAPTAAVVETPVAPPRVEPPVRPVPAPPVPASNDSLALVLSPRDECWVSLTIDGDLVFSRVMRGGERASYEANEEIILNIGDAGAFGFMLNEQDGRTLGDSGEVVTETITLENYRSFIAP
ncbi:MAG: RodZ domain-containing protein [bacterium]